MSMVLLYVNGSHPEAKFLYCYVHNGRRIIMVFYPIIRVSLCYSIFPVVSYGWECHLSVLPTTHNWNNHDFALLLFVWTSLDDSKFCLK